MSEFEVFQEEEFDEKELGSFLSSIFQDCDDDCGEAESNALANGSFEFDSGDSQCQNLGSLPILSLLPSLKIPFT